MREREKEERKREREGEEPNSPPDTSEIGKQVTIKGGLSDIQCPENVFTED